MQTTLILGIGNTLLADEGLGIHLLDYLIKHYPDLPGVTYLDGGTLSFTLAGPIADCQRLIVVDAAAMGTPPGTVQVFEGMAMDRQLSLHAKTVHEVSLADLFDIARLTDTLPERRALVGIEPAVVDWGSEPTPVVQAAIPEAMARVHDLIAAWDAEAA